MPDHTPHAPLDRFRPLLVLSYALWALGLTFWQGNEDVYIYAALASEERESEYPTHAGRLLAVTATFGMLGSLVGSASASQWGRVWECSPDPCPRCRRSSW